MIAVRLDDEIDRLYHAMLIKVRDQKDRERLTYA